MALVGDTVDADLLNGFVKVFDERLIQGTDGALVEWAEDFIRMAEGNIMRFETRPPLHPLSAREVAVLRELLSPGGSVWNTSVIDDFTRGVIIEVDLAHTEYRAWGWSPGGTAIDYTEGVFRAQLKTTRSSNPSLSSALGRLIDIGKAEGATQFIFDVRKQPGLDLTSTRNALLQYMQLNYPDDVGNVTLKFLDYEFVP